MDMNQDVTSSNNKLECPNQTSTVPKLLSAHSDAKLNQVNSIINVSYGPYVNIRYPVNSSSQTADSTIRPLSSSGRIVKIPIWYIPSKCTVSIGAFQHISQDHKRLI